jgi:hypothetical protein
MAGGDYNTMYTAACPRFLDVDLFSQNLRENSAARLISFEMQKKS